MNRFRLVASVRPHSQEGRQWHIARGEGGHLATAEGGTYVIKI